MKILLLAAIVTTFAAIANAQNPTLKGLHWMSSDPAVEIFLVDRMTDYNLVVITEKSVKLTYRSSWNSSQDITKVLEPVKTVGDRRYYLARHSFSRTTIWMALDFEIGGKEVPELTRTFYDGLLNVVENDKYRLKAPK